MKEDLLAALNREIELQSEYLDKQVVNTIYFGGGTPSLLSADEINRLFDVIRQHNTLETKEITLEANPDDLTPSYLKSLKATPINRLSIGVQSFFERDLRYMNRAHSAQQADYAIKAAQDIGFTDLTIDLIYGTPGLSDQDWIANLNKLKELQLPHFSSYALTVEEGTALHHAIQKKKQAPLDAEQAAGQFEILLDKAAEMGFEQYEISNFAKPGCYALHNTNYWKGIPYLGLGPSAHSFNGRARRWNIANNGLYIKELLQYRRLLFEEEILTAAQQLNEYIMTSLRTMWGCDLNYISARWGADTGGALKKASEDHQERNWLTLQDEKLILTAKGKLFADKIASELFIDENS